MIEKKKEKFIISCVKWHTQMGAGMKKKSLFTKMTALLLAAVVGMSVIGCGADPTAETSGQKQTQNNQEGKTDNTAPEGSNDALESEQGNNTDSSGMGRYMEKAVLETENVVDQIQLQLLANGQPMFLNSYSAQRFQATDGGDTWEKLESEEFSAFRKEHYPTSSAIAKDGTIALINMEEKEGQENLEYPDYDYILNVYMTDNTVKNIPVALPDNESNINVLTFGDNGRLYVGANKCNSIFEVDIEEGTAKKLVDLPEHAVIMNSRGNILMCTGYEKTYFYNLEDGKLLEDEILDKFVQENYQGVSWFGDGYSAFLFLGKDNSVYVAGEKGLYRHVIGGSAMEQVIDGALSSLGDPAHGIMAMMENDNQEFFAAFSDGKVMRFTYDPNVSATPNEKLTVYSLVEQDMVKQAISAYRTVYPDMYINYEIGMDGDGVTREDALKKLNTKLLSGEGPDVIILDGMDSSTYADKGVLVDLSDIVAEVNQSDGLYMNLITPLYYGDNLYTVPAQFRIPMIGGHKETMQNVSDYAAMAEMIEKARTENPEAYLMGIFSESGIIKRLAPVCAPSWKNKDGQIEEAKIKEFLELTKQIYEAQVKNAPEEYTITYQSQIAESKANGTDRENDFFFMMMTDVFYLMEESPFMCGEVMSAYEYLITLSIPRIEGFEDSVFQKMNGQSSNVYHPTVLAGINSATSSLDQAKEFVKIMLSTSVQDSPHDGLPINKKSLANLFAYDESQLGENGALYSMSRTTKDGKTSSMIIYPASPEDVKELERIIAELQTPYISDVVLEDAIITEGGKYFNGDQDIDAAVKAVMDKVAIYMAE